MHLYIHVCSTEMVQHTSMILSFYVLCMYAYIYNIHQNIFTYTYICIYIYTYACMHIYTYIKINLLIYSHRHKRNGRAHINDSVHHAQCGRAAKCREVFGPLQETYHRIKTPINIGDL